MSFEIFQDPRQSEVETDEALLDRYRPEIGELKSIMEALKKEPGTYALWQIKPFTARRIAKMINVRQQLSMTSDLKSLHTIVKLKETK